MRCTKCGAEIGDGQKFCTKCGTIVTTQSVQSAQPVQSISQKDKKNHYTALMIGVCIVAALVVLLLAIVAVRVLVADKGVSGESEMGLESLKHEDRDFEGNVKNRLEDTPDSGKDPDSIPIMEEAVSAGDLLYQKKQELCEQLGDASGKSYDIRYKDTENYGRIGVLGSLIMDVSGDEVEDLIVVYSDDNFTVTYADVYTVENREVVAKVTGLELWEGTPLENGEGVAYLKLTENGWNLIGDSASREQYFVDGVEGTIVAYSCQNHSYSTIVNEFYAGSDLSETERQIYGYGRKAGLSVDEMYLGCPYVLEDRDVHVIAGYIQRTDDSIDWQTWYQRAPKGSLYGTLRIVRLTTQECGTDREAACDFLDECSDTDAFYESTSDINGDYILPDSSNRKLTAQDMKSIENDAYLLRLARNELYARHGRKFDSNELMTYFMSKDWYEPLIEPEDFNENILTEIEKYNRDLIKQYEAALD